MCVQNGSEMSDCNELRNSRMRGEYRKSAIDKIRNLSDSLPKETTITRFGVHLMFVPVSFPSREHQGKCKAHRRSLWTVKYLGEFGNVPQSSIHPPSSGGMRVRPQPRHLQCGHNVVNSHDIDRHSVLTAASALIFVAQMRPKAMKNSCSRV